MGPSINTSNTEWHAAISADLLTIFFISDRPGGLGGTDLWVAQRSNRNADWLPAQNLGPTLNSATDEFTPALSTDGHWLYYSSRGFSSDKHLQIYASFRSNTSDNLGWGPPIDLGPGVNSSHYTGDPSVFVDPQTGVLTLYFARLERESDDWNIYQSTLGSDGTFGVAVPVAELNTRFRETRPTVRRDGLEIVFVSDRPGSLGGVDLWTSTRPTTSDKWSTPVNLGPTVNTEFEDRAPYLSDDGQTLILVSNRPGGFGNTDLYVSTRKKLSH
jgi:Tol biopolymer transport system component